MGLIRGLMGLAGGKKLSGKTFGGEGVLSRVLGMKDKLKKKKEEEERRKKNREWLSTMSKDRVGPWTSSGGF